jgi:hypothetical protein
MQMRPTLLFFLAWSLYCPAIGFGQENQAIGLGTQRVIFVDLDLIDRLEGAQVLMHRPEDKGKVIDLNKPWEGIFCGYTTIIKDGALYRAYYRGWPALKATGKKGSKSANPDEHLSTTCYAESKDGIHWVKPLLKLQKINGSVENNVILAREAATHNFSPFLDSKPDAPANQRYKALGGTLEGGGLFAYSSADGIHWKKLSDQPITKNGMFDSQNVCFWSVSEGFYICYFRTWSGTGYKGYRTVSRITSTDFLHWSEPVAMTFGDTPPEQLYTQQTSPYFRAPQIYIAIGGRLMEGRQVLTPEQAAKIKVDSGYFHDVSDAYFMTSRGGSRYNRMFMESFIRPGTGAGDWVSRTNYPALNVVQTGPEEMSVYVNKDYAQPTACLERYALRLDGFTSLYAPYKGGEMVTKPFTFSGSELEINYATSAAGEISMEIQDERGEPVPGFTLKDMQRLTGNEISRMVSWNGNQNLKTLAGKPVRLHIYLKDADLYSFRFK